MGQKQRDKKNKKISAKIELEIAVKQKRRAKTEKIRKIGLRVGMAIVILAILGLSSLAIMKNKDLIKGKYNPAPLQFGQYGVIETDKGKMVFELYSNDAPKTTENFKLLTDRKYYDNLVFHRVVEDFVIQGGDPKGDGSGGESAWGDKFEDEINPRSIGVNDDTIKQYESEGYKYNDKLQSHKMIPGAVAMANSGANTNGSQFFIVISKDQPHLDGKHTVFGQVIEGMDVVGKISQGDKMSKVYVIEKEEYDLSKIK